MCSFSPLSLFLRPLSTRSLSLDVRVHETVVRNILCQRHSLSVYPSVFLPSLSWTTFPVAAWQFTSVFQPTNTYWVERALEHVMMHALEERGVVQAHLNRCSVMF
jgi:hypothetical protein